jgi:hypothetical protein
VSAHFSGRPKSFPSAHWSKQSTAPLSDVESRHFRITHPYPTLFAQEFELVLRAQSWREDRVWFQDADARLRSLPASWASIIEEDPFNVVAAGRAAFRIVELLELARLIGECKPRPLAVPVKLTMPES